GNGVEFGELSGSVHVLAIPCVPAARRRTALASRSFKWCEQGGNAAKSPEGTVITAGREETVHGRSSIDSLCGLVSPKKQNPRSGCRPGVFVKRCGRRPCVPGACWVSDAGVAKPIPVEEVTGRCARTIAHRRAAGSEGSGSGGVIEHGGFSKTMSGPYCKDRSDASPTYRLMASMKRGVAESSIFSERKSYRLRSASCDGATFCSARNMTSVRPGLLRSHSWSISLTTWRCRLSWEPHRLQGMIGNSRSRA